MQMTQIELAALTQANKTLAGAGLPTINEMMGKQAEAVQTAMTPVLRVTVRSNYGAPAIYPANDAARIFAAIAGTKTILLDTLSKAKKLGYQIEQVEDPASQLIYVPGLQALVVQQC